MNKENYELFIKENVNFQAELYEEYGTMINFLIESNGYIGHGPIYLNRETVQTAISSLSNMIDTLTGEVVLEDIESIDHYVKMNFSGNRLIVKGCVGDYNEHRLYFSFIADQTLLSLLLEVLKELNSKKS